MKVLFDTNVILDLLLDRQPYSEAASLLVARVERGEIAGYVCATTITTIFYLATKVVGITSARIQIKKILELFEVALVNRYVLDSALTSSFNDFEDAVLYEAAKYAGVDCIVTRNIKDFKLAKLPVYLPSELESVSALSERK